jgi:hypothetical protein
VSFCASAHAIRKLAAANAAVAACDPFLPNACSSGLVCEPSAAGVRLTCVDGADGGLVTEAVGGVCVPARRELVSARFSDSGREVVLSLNAAARGGLLPCGSVFSQDTAAALGRRASCTAQDRTLTVGLGSGATLLPGDVLELRPGQAVLLDKLQSSVAFNGSAVVASCSDCAAPTAVLTGPQVGGWAAA